MKRVLLAWTLLIFLTSLSAFAASGAIRGHISDAETGDPLQGVTVRVQNRPWGTYTGRGGDFLLRSIPTGSYTLLISLIGYEVQQIPVTIRDNDTTNIAVQLVSQPLQTGEIVVSASKRIQAVQDVPVSISIVDQRAIEQRNITKLDEALRYVPGVYMSREQVNIRGSSGFSLGLGSRTLILLDGFPLLSGDGGDAKFDALPMFNVERVEVIKGAGSALYGTGALGGVINVVTAEPATEPEFRVSAFSGVYTGTKYDHWKFSSSPPFLGGLRAGYSQKYDDVDLMVSGGLIRDEGHQEFYDSFRWNLFAKAGYHLSASSSLSILGTAVSERRANWVFWNSLDSATFPPAGTNLDEYVTSTKQTGALQFNHIFNESLFMVVRTGLYRTHFDNSASTQGNDSLASTAYATNTELQLTSIVNNNLLFTLGLNGQYNFVTESYLGKNNQSIVSGYIQGEYKPIETVTITAGGRFDSEKTSSITDKNSEFSPKIGVSFRPLEQTSFRLSAGRGFRAPTIGERFASLRFNGLTVESNPALNPERGWSFEVGGTHTITLANEPWKFDVALFQNEFTNMIEPQLQPQTARIRFVNVTRARIQGAEVNIGGWLPGKLAGLEAALTAMMPLNVDSNTVLKYRSKFLVQTRLMIPVGAFQVQADYRFQSRVETIDELLAVLRIPDVDARVPIHVLDLRLIADLYSLAEIPVMATLNVKNALNHYYTEIIANLAPTRSVLLQLDARL